MDLYECKIMLVDDNAELAQMISDILRRDGYRTVVSARSVRSGWELFQAQRPDMAILDIMLPDGDGFALFQKIRQMSRIPMLFLSARDEDRDRLFGLGLGADDYITKPFLPQELVLRVRAVLKRTYQPIAPQTEERLLHLGAREVSFDRACVTYDGRETAFTAKELALLAKLNENRGKIVTFDALCSAVWGDSYYGYENTLMVHIRHLREKIEENPSRPRWLLTARGLGYRLAQDSGEMKEGKASGSVSGRTPRCLTGDTDRL